MTTAVGYASGFNVWISMFQQISPAATIHNLMNNSGIVAEVMVPTSRI